MKRWFSVVPPAAAIVLLAGLLAPASAGQGAGPQPEGDGKQKAEPASSTPAGEAGTPAAQVDLDEDLSFDRAQPDFTIVTLPTTLRLPHTKFAFRVSHRFSRPLGQGDFGDLVADLFGLDSSAGIGLELRYGLLPGTQIGIFRNNGKTIQFFGQHNLLRQSDEQAIGLDALVTIEGTRNFGASNPPGVDTEFSPAVGLVLSSRVGDRSSVYVEPIWVGNTNPLPDDLADENHTFMVGLGARAGISSTVSLVLQVTPRVAGYDPETLHVTFGIERLVGGHTFQLNFSNSFAQTMAEVARGGFEKRRGQPHFWFIGFNISRKFY